MNSNYIGYYTAVQIRRFGKNVGIIIIILLQGGTKYEQCV